MDQGASHDGQDDSIQYDHKQPLRGQQLRYNSVGHSSGGLFRRVPSRYVLFFLIFLGEAITFGNRSMFSVLVVCMSNYTSPSSTNDTSDDCPGTGAWNQSTPPVQKKEGEFEWDTTTQTTLIGVFFYGYALLQVPGGLVAEKYGAKKVLCLTIFTSSAVTLVMPFAARWHVDALIASRAALGAVQGALYPARYAFMSRWLPRNECSTILSILGTAWPLGVQIAQSVAGALCDSSFLGGWPAPFYLYGSLGIIWCILWILLAHDTPRDHPRISIEERQYIETSTDLPVKYSNPPWFSILTSVPFMALLMTSLMDAISGSARFSCLPLYFKQILHLDSTHNGLLSSGALSATIPVTILAGIIPDQLMARGLLGRTGSRKMMSSIGLFSNVLAALSMGFLVCNETMFIVVLFLGQMLNSFNAGGHYVNTIDLAPQYCGTLTGISNMLVAASGFVGPLLVGQLTQGRPSSLKWRNLFLMAAGMEVVALLSFVIFGSGERQEWDKKGCQSDDPSNPVDTNINRQVRADRQWNRDLVAPADHQQWNHSLPRQADHQYNYRISINDA